MLRRLLRLHKRIRARRQRKPRIPKPQFKKLKRNKWICVARKMSVNCLVPDWEDQRLQQRKYADTEHFEAGAKGYKSDATEEIARQEASEPQPEDLQILAQETADPEDLPRDVPQEEQDLQMEQENLL